MHPRFETLTEKKLVGKRMTISLANNRTGELWRSFMQRKKDITNNKSSDLYSMQVFDPMYFTDFNPAREFEKWAAIEVTDLNAVPNEFESFVLPPGLYAVFIHKGSSTDLSTFNYIYNTWLPSAAYTLDNRPHFEILGEKYRNNDPSSEEEIWIPVKPK
jgi:AraC family transcriptional regulator